MSPPSAPTSGAGPRGATPGELGLGLSATFCALAVAASNLCAIAAETAFVGLSTPGELAAFGVASAAARSAVALGLAAIADRTSRDIVGGKAATRFETSFFGLAALALVVSAVALRSGGHASLWLACLVPSTLPALAPVVAFQSASSSVGPRRARVLLPKLAAASTVGSIVAGVVASRLGVGTASIGLIVAGAGFAASALLPARLHADATAAAQPRTGGSALAGSFAATVASPIARVVIAFAVASAALASTVDLAFKLALQEAGDPAAIGPTLAISHVVSNALVLGLQLFATTRLVERVGMRGALGAAGVSSVVLGPIVALAPSVATSLGLRFTEGAARYALGSQVADLLLTAAPAAARARVKALAKGLAGPVGALVAGGLAALAVALAGGVRTMGIASVLIGALVVVIASAAPRAYADALRSMLKRAPVPLDDAAIGAHRAAVLGRLRRAVAEKDAASCEDLLELADPRFFMPSDLAPFLATPSAEIRRAVALRIAERRDDEATRVLLATAPDDDVLLEGRLLAALRARGAQVPIERLRRAIEKSKATDDVASARLFAEGSLGVALAGRGSKQPEIERESRVAITELRRAARGAAGVTDDAGPRRIAALAALTVLADRKCEREVQLGLATSHPEVFIEAARAGLAIEAPGVVATLVRALRSGPHVRVAGRALRAARRRAVNELLAALPVTQGEGGVVVTAVASARTVTGSVRAARVVAHLGTEGAIASLERLGDLGFRARDAVVRAVARSDLAAEVSGPLAAAATRFVETGVGLIAAAQAHAATPRGLYHRELEARLGSVRDRLVDIAGALDASGALRRGRGAIDGGGARAEAALELVEASLGRELGPRAVAVLTGTTIPGAAPVALSADGWLGRVRAFEAGELPSTDPMRDVLDRVRVLRDVPLFAALSGEELYPVAEVAERVARDAGEEVVAEGDPSDALFVVAEGRCEVLRGGVRVSELASGQAFGELGVLDGEPRAATVRAIIPTVLLRIPRDELEALLDESPELARSIIRHLVAFARKRG